MHTPNVKIEGLIGIIQGAGARVRRSIGSMTLRNLTPFLMLDHFHVSKGAVSNMIASSSHEFRALLKRKLGFP